MANKTVTVKAADGDYTTLNAALAGEAVANPDLTAGGMDGILTIDCYAVDDTTAADTGTGYTTDATHYINITVHSGERHSGIWTGDKYNLCVSGASGLIVREDYVRIDGLQIQLTSAGTDKACVYFAGQSTTDCDLRVSNCIFKGVITGGSGVRNFGIHTYESSAARTRLRCWNCIAYNFFNDDYHDNTDNHGFANEYGVSYFWNCTAYNCGRGFAQRSSYDTYCTNCVSINYVNNSNYIDYSSIASQSYNISSDTTSAGTGSIDSQGLTDVDFVSTTAGSEDFHLQSTSTAIGAGVDLSGDGYFSTDIDGDTRSGWDIGADEYAAAGGGVSIPVFMRTYRNMRT